MNKKIISLCSLLVALAFVFVVTGTSSVNMKKNDISVAQMQEYYAEGESQSTTSSGLNIGNKVSDVVGDVAGNVGGYVSNIAGVAGAITSVAGGSGGFGDIVGGIGSGGSSGGSGSILGGLGDVVGGLFGKNDTSSATAATQSPTYNSGTIIPVPAASQAYTQATQTQSSVIITSSEIVSDIQAETFNSSVSTNPYTKPIAEFKAGDKDESIKWVQWIFVYTGYGLDESGITGELDDATVTLIKKLQTERGLTVDGNINDEVVDKVELLYYEYTLSANNSTTLPNTVITQSDVYQTSVDNTDTDNTSKWITVIIIALVWIIAAFAIFYILVIKKKKGKKKTDSDKKIDYAQAENKEEIKTLEEKQEKPKQTEVTSMADLFEEANDK